MKHNGPSGGGPRLSTNELLENIINAPDDDDNNSDDDTRNAAIMAKKIQRAQQHLGRASLYGAGARCKLPKVRRKKKESKSPFSILKPDLVPEKQLTLSDSIPPGVHSDNFRRVCNNTRKSMNDPESYQYTTTSMTEGISYAPGQPPWYVGYNNKTVPPDSSLIYAASRYGFRGSKGIKQYETKSYQMPMSTMTEHTPKFLDCSFKIDEWVPPILARPYQTINGLESPKLWPENTEYPSGARLKKAPTSIRYNRETTIATSDSVQIPAQLTEYISRVGDLDNTLRDFAKMETCNTFLSGPMTAQLTFETRWNDRVAECASKQLQATLNTNFVRYDPHHLTDSSDKITYAGKTAFIVHSQATDEFKLRIKSESSLFLTAYENQWNQIILAFKVIKGYLKRDVSMTTVINSISSSLHDHATAAGTVTQLNRIDFMDAFRSISFCAALTSQQVSSLFNSFDHFKRNSMRLVDLIVDFTILDNPLDSTLLKLVQIWVLHEQYGDSSTAMDISLNTLLSCCVTDSERREMEKLFKQDFRPMCYSMSLRAPKQQNKESFNFSPNMSPTSASSNHIDNNFTFGFDKNGTNDYQSAMVELQIRHPMMGQRSVSSVGSYRESNPNLNDTQPPRSSTASSPTRDTRSMGSKTPTLKSPKNKNMASLSTYSITEKFLVGPHDFIEVLLRCPNILVFFSEKLSERMVQCFGLDERIPIVKKPDEKIVIEDVDKDYSWILKSKSVSKKMK